MNLTKHDDISQQEILPLSREWHWSQSPTFPLCKDLRLSSNGPSELWKGNKTHEMISMDDLKMWIVISHEETGHKSQKKQCDFLHSDCPLGQPMLLVHQIATMKLLLLLSIGLNPVSGSTGAFLWSWLITKVSLAEAGHGHHLFSVSCTIGAASCVGSSQTSLLVVAEVGDEAIVEALASGRGLHIQLEHCVPFITEALEQDLLFHFLINISAMFPSVHGICFSLARHVLDKSISDRQTAKTNKLLWTFLEWDGIVCWSHDIPWVGRNDEGNPHCHITLLIFKAGLVEFQVTALPTVNVRCATWLWPQACAMATNFAPFFMPATPTCKSGNLVDKAQCNWHEFWFCSMTKVDSVSMQLQTCPKQPSPTSQPTTHSLSLPVKEPQQHKQKAPGS